MRLRSFTGKTMSDALAHVRQHLGDDAVIVATQEDEDGSMRVTAALDEDAAPAPLPRNQTRSTRSTRPWRDTGCRPTSRKKFSLRLWRSPIRSR